MLVTFLVGCVAASWLSGLLNLRLGSLPQTEMSGLSQSLLDSNLTLLYNPNETWAVCVYQSKRCPFSEALMEKWPDISLTITERNASIRIVQIDAWNNREAAAILEVKVLPTIKLITQGKVYTYRKEFEPSAIVEFFASDYLDLRWFNRLPTSYSLLNKWQLDLFFFTQSIDEHLASFCNSQSFLSRVLCL